MSENRTLKYNIIPDLNLQIDCWFGELSFEKILSSKLEQAKDPLWKQEYNNISDIRNAVLLLSNEEARKIIDYTRTDERWQYNRKTAYFTDNPNQIVFQKLLEINLSLEIPNKIEAFSTLEGIISWLGINRQEFNRINTILKELKEIE